MTLLLEMLLFVLEGRHKNVAHPSITNAGAFAGVLANNYKASSRTVRRDICAWF